MSAGRIELSGVWKKFHYGELHNRLADWIPALVRRATRRRRDALEGDEFWALADVSFTVRPGEALGLIGPNGAGKSTVLKLLTRIMRPTRGSVVLQGRVGALIEVAGGFHPDLTGRENVYLQGVIMGMPRREIAAKFDRIVEFAGVGPFIDTPIKRYSSGMHARLGFAIAAHFEPEVLLIDEALAVGDAAFQARAYKRITELVENDIPVVFVSHQLDQIARLCNRAILLERGRVTCAGTPAQCIEAYLESEARLQPAGTGTPRVRVEAIGVERGRVASGERVRMTLECVAAPGDEADEIRVRVRAADSGWMLYEIETGTLGVTLPAAGHFVLDLELQMNLKPGLYRIETGSYDRPGRRDVQVGPTGKIQVTDGLAFEGIVQLNPAMSVRAARLTSTAR